MLHKCSKRTRVIFELLMFILVSFLYFGSILDLYLTLGASSLVGYPTSASGINICYWSAGRSV